MYWNVVAFSQTSRELNNGHRNFGTVFSIQIHANYFEDVFKFERSYGSLQ